MNILSLSGGKDSTALLILCIKEKIPIDIALNFDTGMEFNATYQTLSKSKSLCEENGIKYVSLKSKNSFYYDMLKRPVKKHNGQIQCGYMWCGGCVRWGTANKIKAINDFYRTIDEPITELVGIAADEKNRMKPGKQYPLVEYGLPEKDCLQMCYDNGFNWREKTSRTKCGYIELYDILDRVSCWCCGNKNLKELRNIKKFLPEYWLKLLSLQSKISMPYYNGLSLFDLDARFNWEMSQMDIFQYLQIKEDE